MRGAINTYKNVIALGFVSLFTDISSEMCFAILPVFIITELGASVILLGVIEGSGEFSRHISQVFSGIASDRAKRRKPFILCGYAVSNLIKPLFFVAKVWFDALIIRIGDRLGKGIRTPARDALITESVSESRYGRAFGIHRTLDQLGAVIGPMLAFVILTAFPFIGLRGVFLLSLVPGLVAILILILAVKETVPIAEKSFSSFSFKEAMNKRLLIILLALCMFAVGTFNFSFILIKAGEMGMEIAFIPLVYLLINIFHTVASYPAGILADKIGRDNVFSLGYCLFLTTLILAILLKSGSLSALIIAAFYGFFLGIIEAVQRALIAEKAPPAARATTFGIFYLAIGVSYFVANVIVGVLWDIVGSEGAFLYSFTITAIALIVFRVILKKI